MEASAMAIWRVSELEMFDRFVQFLDNILWDPKGYQMKSDDFWGNDLIPTNDLQWLLIFEVLRILKDRDWFKKN